MRNKLLTIVVCISILYIYKNWFLLPQIIGGDWPYYYPQTLRELLFPPVSWVFWRGNGLGGIDIAYSLHIYEHFTTLLSTFFHIPWPIIYKIFWFGLFLLLNFFSISYLYSVVFSKKFSVENIVAVLIYSTNTYILLIASGGQMGYAVGYSLAPFVLGILIRLSNFCLDSPPFPPLPPLSGASTPRALASQKRRPQRRGIRESGELANSNLTNLNKLILKKSLLLGLLLGLLLMIDLRVAYLIILAMGLYVLFNLQKNIRNTIYFILYTLIFPGVIAFLLNLSWILPLVLLKQNVIQEVGGQYNSIASLEFFSFADFSHGFSLLHPNWPENIFGKIYFLQPEFLILPIIAFSSLLFVNSSKLKSQSSKPQLKTLAFAKVIDPEASDRRATADKQKFNNNGAVRYFALLGLIGVFLAKGTNDPFGFIYTFLYQHIPGFIMFRDPTKFYVFIALAYSILVPYSLYTISNFQFSISNFKSQKIKNILITKYFILYTLFFLFWLFLIRQAVFGKLNDTFQSHTFPLEYQKLAEYLQNQNQFSRTLWVPRQQRFSYSTSLHPAMEAEPLFNATTSAEILRVLPEKQQYLSDLGVEYIIVPYDPYGEIFQKDRKYNKEEYLSHIHALQNIPWLTQLSGFGKIALFEKQGAKDHFFLTNVGSVNYHSIDTTHYQVTVQTQQPNTLVFSDAYNRYWIATANGQTVQSQQTNEGLNSFTLSKPGTYNFNVVFAQQQYYTVGFIVSAVAFIGIIIAVIVLK